MSSNNRKYFDQGHGCTFNNVCPDCGSSTWASERVQTLYHGKEYLGSKDGDIVGIIDFNGRVWCPKCWAKNEMDKKGLESCD